MTGPDSGPVTSPPAGAVEGPYSARFRPSRPRGEIRTALFDLGAADGLGTSSHEEER